ncbi:flagellar biosynthesis anti-sigma factor FlgM [Petrotoga sp. 9PWA.NaAc.5.4]|uniref:flagellar biosynthesis anti-sigma factor FlgM n=1 Tax=Petrotoga sp. 9PWA.NaAc.5.4 TaxID=1434328 RepID=UPI000CBA42F1|nr:flagellar biosynthesis anti-sigma factor FlgM [Petrotoga sp. 9PWA.NaAc.5.4]PNR94734.1 hypothetical protein X924_05580 [Petrotoga sp. 9PWA.NaAc.5.4]
MDINNINPMGNNNFNKINEANTKKTNEKQLLRDYNQENVYNITGNSKRYVELSKEIPEIREDIVAKLKEAIENGSYQIDVEKIVNKMLE